MQLEKLIVQRLERTGKAHISGWGTFYLKAEESKWNHITNTAFPAGKYVHFSPNPTSSTDHVVAEVMKTLGASMEVAQQWILRKINAWQEVIDRGDVLMLPGLGSFPAAGKFNAEPGTFDADSFGFVSLMLHPLSEQSALKANAVVSLKRPVEDAPSALKRWQRAGAAAAVAALFGVSIMQSSVATQVAGWFAGSATETSISPSSEASIEEHNIDVVIEDKAVISSESDEVRPVETSVLPVRQASYVHGYSVVVGSFKEGSNADSFAAELANKGLDVMLIPGSLTKVGVGYYADRSAATEAISSIKASVNSGAWIYAF